MPGGQGRQLKSWAVPLSQPTLREDDLATVVDVYRSGWLTMGPKTAELEAEVAEYAGVDAAVAVSSCTAALHLAQLATGIGEGAEVIVPSLTFVATPSAITYTGARPRFADIRGLTEPWLSVDAAEAAIGPATKAILTVHYGGHLGEVERLAELADAYDLVLIEDAAHAAGSWSAGRHAGGHGAAGALSFSASKNLGIGEGGMLLTNDPQLAARAARLRWHGVSRSIWERHQAQAPNYDVDEIGFNYRLDDPRSALALCKLRRLDADNARRARIDTAFREAFAGLKGLKVTEPPPVGERNSHCLFTLVLDEPVDRQAFRASLADNGVQTSVHFPPAHRSAAHAQPGVRLPNTEAYAERSVSLPMYPDMTSRQQEQVIEAVEQALSRPRQGAAAVARA